MNLRNTQVVRFDFYADKQGFYENKYFSFKVNYPHEYQHFVINTFYKFRRQCNKIKAMFLVYGNGFSERVTGEKFAQIFSEYKSIRRYYADERDKALFLKNVASELRRKGYII